MLEYNKYGPISMQNNWESELENNKWMGFKHTLSYKQGTL